MSSLSTKYLCLINRNGGGPVLLSLTTMIPIAVVSLQVLRVLFIIEDATPDMLELIGVSELSMRGRVG